MDKIWTKEEIHTEGAKRFGTNWLLANETALNIVRLKLGICRQLTKEEQSLMVASIFGVLFLKKKQEENNGKK